jgi:hypothetical protein
VAHVRRGRALLSRAYWNLRLFGLPNPVRDVWMVALTALIVATLAGQDSRLDRQRDGRRIAIQALCGVQQGAIAAGRQQLLKYGLTKDADEYARTVAQAVERESGVPGLLTPDGRLRCERLVRAGHAQK